MCKIVTEKTICVHEKWEERLGERDAANAPRLCSVDPDMVPEAEKGQSAPTPGGPPHSWRAQPHPLWAACWIRRLCVRKLGEWLSPLTTTPGQAPP